MEYLLRNLKEGTLAFNKNGNLVYISEYMLKSLNYRLNEIEKLNFEDIISINGVSDNIYETYMSLLSMEIIIQLYTKEKKLLNYFSIGKMVKFNGEDIILIDLEECNDVNNIQIYMKYIFNEFLKHGIDEENVVGEDINFSTILERIVREIKHKNEIETELELILNTAIDLVSILDEKGNFLKVNSRWKEVFGWDEEYLLSINAKDIMHEDDIPSCNIRLSEANENLQLLKYRNRYRCKDGSYKWIDWKARYFPEIKKFIATATDITETLEMEKKHKYYEKELQLERIRMEFFSNISHELKTPLSIIIATIQLIDKNIEYNNINFKGNDSFNKYLNSIRQNSFRLVKLVNNIGDMYKIEAGYYEVNLENRDIVNVVESITMSVVEYIENMGVEIIFDTNVEELFMAIDTDKIERILFNLISNALKHIGNNGRIKVDIKASDEEVEISVEDNGIGISKENLNLIFDRFSQVDADITIRRTGSGIGLALVQSLVKMHNGTISVESTENVGSRFYFTLPIKVLDECFIKEVIQDSNSKVEKCIVEFSDIYR